VRTGLLLALALAACSTPGAPSSRSTVAIDTALRAPSGDSVPTGVLGRSIRRGRAILRATRDSLPEHVGSALRCASCHLDDGRNPAALPLTGVYARYPQYRSRGDAVQRLEDRVNDCFERSLNGRALAFDDPAMRDIIDYLAFISRGVPVTGAVHAAANGAVRGDAVAGAALFAADCARCHGNDGAGQLSYPPLWGPRSFTIGAGMARLHTAAAFIHANMPRDHPGTLSAEEATNVAAYITSRERPDFAGKENDWPRGDAPPDTPYPTRTQRKP
jgi:thiosulfate dehydrogenase